MIKIVITRPREKTKSTLTLAQDFGFGALSFPLLKLAPVYPVNLNRPLSEYNWVLFTSSNAIHFFVDYCNKENIRFPAHIKFAAVGPGTAQTLQSFGLTPSFVPYVFNRTAVSRQLPVRKREVVLYPALADGPESTEKVLKERGCVTDRFNVYRSTPLIYNDREWQALAKNNPEVISFFSPRTIQAFFKNKQDSVDLNKYVIAVLAPSGAAELKKFGYHADITADIPIVQNLFQGIKKYYE